MQKITQLDENLDIAKFCKESYLNYSLYVITDRALPHIADGLKPVQRRIIFAMSELGLSALAKFKKSARTIGDVLGKYHPHGDSACYEAMVLMAQPFSYRYPLIHGQGNFGAPDAPKSFAAMRYTEAKLRPIAKILLSELNVKTTSWQDNFDGTLKEPAVFPALLPNILLNGSTGIAVGMATDIPPHNLKEVIDACIFILDNQEEGKKQNITVKNLMRFIKGPDYPGLAQIITPKEEIEQIYQNAKGSIKQRATYKGIEQKIIINSLPHQISSTKIIEQITKLITDKKIQFIKEIADISDEKEPINIEITLFANNKIDHLDLMLHLFYLTDLEKSIRINFNMLDLDFRPKVKNIEEILTKWLEFRKITVKKRLNFELENINKRLEILEGLKIVYLHLDRIIEIIRNEDFPEEVLAKEFSLSQNQIKSILDTRLRALAKLEEQKLDKEISLLKAKKEEKLAHLKTDQNLELLIKDELLALKSEFKTKRNSKIVSAPLAKEFLFTNDKSINEDLSLIISKESWFKTIKSANFDPSRVYYKTGDSFLLSLSCKTLDPICFLTNKGKIYQALAKDLPRQKNIFVPLSSFFNFTNLEKVCFAFKHQLNQEIILLSSLGFGFRTSSENLTAKNKKGKNLINLNQGAKLLSPIFLEQKYKYIALATNLGRLLLMPIDEISTLTSGKGAKLIHLHKGEFEEEYLKFACLFDKKNGLEVIEGENKINLQDNQLNFYFIKTKIKSANLLPKGFQRITDLKAI